MVLTRKKIIPEIPKFSSPSLEQVYIIKIPLKPQKNSAVKRTKLVYGITCASFVYDLNLNQRVFFQSSERGNVESSLSLQIKLFETPEICQKAMKLGQS